MRSRPIARPALLAGGIVLAAGYGFAADTAPAEPGPSPAQACACHDMTSPRSRAPAIDLRGWAKDGKHRAAGCGSCHPGADRRPHPKGLARRDCGSCHAKEAADWTQTVHGRAAGKDPRIQGCMTCHTEHAAVAQDDVRARYVNTGLLHSCAACHAPMPVSPIHLKTNAAPPGKPWPSSLHGLVVDIDRTSVANCGSCHGVHQIFPSSDPRSDVNPTRLAQTCGSCHEGVRPAVIHGTFRVNTNGWRAWVTDYFDIWYLWTGGTVVLTILGIVSLAGIGAVLRGRKRTNLRA